VKFNVNQINNYSNVKLKERQKMINKDDLYFCYSRKLSQYLEQKGIRYLFMAKDINKNNPFSLYVKTDQLLKELENYKLINK
jgi:hypothetical protein